MLNVKNRAKSLLAADITSTDISLTVTTDEGVKFPASNFHITIEDEILLCSSRTTDTFTVERAKEGTTAAAHIAGKAVELRITAKIIEELQTELGVKAADADVLKKDGSVAITADWNIDGANTLFIDKTNSRVGIGTTEPGALLHLNGGTIKVVSNGDKFAFYEDDVAESSAFFKLTNSTGAAGIFGPVLWMKSNMTGTSYANAIIADVTQDIAGQGPVFSFMARANGGTVSNRDLFWFDNGYNNPAMVIKSNGNVGIGTTTPNGRFSLGLPNGQQISYKSLTELTTIGAVATTDTVIQIPANVIVKAVSVRVTVAIPTATSFTVIGSTSTTAFNTEAVSTAVNTTNKGNLNCPYNNGAAQTIRITPNETPADNSGRVRVTIWYEDSIPPTS